MARQGRQQRHPQDGVVATLDVCEHIFEGAARHAPPVAVVGGVVVRGRRRRAVVGDEFPFIPTAEELVPCRVVVGEEARLRALLVAHRFEHLVDGGVEGGAHWRRRDRDTPALRRHPPGAWKSGGTG
jgi:hypothetical protein